MQKSYPETLWRRVGAACAILVLGATCAADDHLWIGQKEPNPRHPEAIRLVSYNIENLFDDRDDPSLTGRYDDFWAYDKSVRQKPREHRRAVADAIRRLDADVIGLQEIESYDALIEFREEFLADMGYEHVMSIDVGQERGIEQAVLSRFPIREARVWPNAPLGGVHPARYGSGENWYAGQPLEYRRSPLFVRIEVPAGARGNAKAYEFGMFVVHHKAGGPAGYWREAEARWLVDKVRSMQRAEPQLNLCIMGDFNTTLDSNVLRMYRDAGFSHAIPDRDPNDTKTMTHHSGRAIDFILFCPAMIPEKVKGSGFVLATPVLARSADWRTAEHPEGYASDHLPVSVDVVPVER